jgi:phosphoenolpyruvate-protein kinase (PTS system EI component)
MLLGVGLRELSMQPRSIPAARQAIAAIDVAEARRGLAEIVGGADPEQSELAAGTGRSRLRDSG